MSDNTFDTENAKTVKYRVKGDKWIPDVEYGFSLARRDKSYPIVTLIFDCLRIESFFSWPGTALWSILMLFQLILLRVKQARSFEKQASFS